MRIAARVALETIYISRATSSDSSDSDDSDKDPEVDLVLRFQITSADNRVKKGVEGVNIKEMRKRIEKMMRGLGRGKCFVKFPRR